MLTIYTSGLVMVVEAHMGFGRRDYSSFFLFEYLHIFIDLHSVVYDLIPIRFWTPDSDLIGFACVLVNSTSPLAHSYLPIFVAKTSLVSTSSPFLHAWRHKHLRIHFWTHEMPISVLLYSCYLLKR